MMNKKDALQGRTDSPLNEKGYAQAEDTGKWFESQGIVFDRVYTSPLIRAKQTGEIASGNRCPVVTDERLIEMDYGPYEGADLHNLPQEIIWFFSDFVNHPAPEGMEQLSSVVERAGRFLEEIRSESDKAVLVSTHAIAMKGLLEYLTPESGGSYWSKYIGNCAVYVSEYKNGRYTVPVELDTTAGN